MIKPDMNTSRALSQKLDDLVQEAMDLQSAVWAYREYYEADQETIAAYDMISPGLNTPMNPIRHREYEEAMAKAVRRMQDAKYRIKQIRGEP